MYPEGYIPTISLKELRVLNDKLNSDVVEQVNNAQELVMLNNFSRECNEYQYKKCSQQRISDIASWRWVLEDLVKRLNEAVEALEHEHNALRVVVHRVEDEIEEHSGAGSRPGAFCPLSDIVEDAIMQEFIFLRDSKKNFEGMIPPLEKEIKILKRTQKRINDDILHKMQTISIEESCANVNVNSLSKKQGNRKKRRIPQTFQWENRCASLKAAGLKALTTAAIVRQKVRGARTHLSIAAQAYAARVDSALRRRMHSNKIKLQDLKWQREEALRDYESLSEELGATENNLLETMDHERLIEARLVDRSLRPSGELIRDNVDRQLRDELGRLRNFSKQLKTNLSRIISLQNHLVASMTRIDCCSEDIFQVVSLDEERIRSRLGEVPECFHRSGKLCHTSTTSSSSQPEFCTSNCTDERLTSITEEDEGDD